MVASNLRSGFGCCGEETRGRWRLVSGAASNPATPRQCPRTSLNWSMAQEASPAVRGNANHPPQDNVWKWPTEIIKRYAKKRGICSWHKKARLTPQFLLKVILSIVLPFYKWNQGGSLCKDPSVWKLCTGSGPHCRMWDRLGHNQTTGQGQASECRVPANTTDYNDTHDVPPMEKWSINTAKESFKLTGISLKDSHKNS